MKTALYAIKTMNGQTVGQKPLMVKLAETDQQQIHPHGTPSSNIYAKVCLNIKQMLFYIITIRNYASIHRPISLFAQRYSLLVAFLH